MARAGHVAAPGGRLGSRHAGLTAPRWLAVNGWMKEEKLQPLHQSTGRGETSGSRNDIPPPGRIPEARTRPEGSLSRVVSVRGPIPEGIALHQEIHRHELIRARVVVKQVARPVQRRNLTLYRGLAAARRAWEQCHGAVAGSLPIPVGLIDPCVFGFLVCDALAHRTLRFSTEFSMSLSYPGHDVW